MSGLHDCGGFLRAIDDAASMLSNGLVLGRSFQRSTMAYWVDRILDPKACKRMLSSVNLKEAGYYPCRASLHATTCRQ